MKRVSLLIAVLCVSFSSVAFAQYSGWVPPRAEEGQKDGFSLSSSGLVLQPTLGAETGYVSNVFFAEESGLGAGVLRVIGGLRLATRQTNSSEFQGAATPVWKFTAGLRASYREFLSTNSSARGLRNLGLVADLNLILFPQGTFRFEVEDTFRRILRPRSFETSQQLNRDINNFRAGIIYQPGGRAISAGLHYENVVDVFEDSEVAFANRLQHIGRLRITWRFFPYSEVYLDGSLGFFTNFNDQTPDFNKSNSSPLRIQAGINTAITERLTVKLRGGYANGFYRTGANYSSPIGAVELGYRYSPVGRIGLGYHYEFRDSIQANFYREHRVQLTLNQQLGRVLFTGRAGGHLRRYEEVQLVGGAPGVVREDQILFAEGQLRYALLDWLEIYGRYNLAAVETDFRFQFIVGQLENPSYVRHEAVLGATVSF